MAELMSVIAMSSPQIWLLETDIQELPTGLAIAAGAASISTARFVTALHLPTQMQPLQTRLATDAQAPE